MENITIEVAWDYLEEIGVAKETLEIITNINGYTLETLQDVLYVVTGYREFDQIEE